MKIGIVCPYNILKGGGVQEHVKALQAELITRGHDVKIITPLPRDVEDPNLPNIIFIGTSSDFKSPTNTVAQISVYVNGDKIDEMLEREQFDILHFHEPWMPDLSRQILQRSEAINIATFHAKIPETLMSRSIAKVVTPYMKSVLKYFHLYTAVSESGAEYARSLTDDPIAIVPNGIDLDAYHLPAKRKDPSGLKSILYIGRLEKRKGVKYLLQAYKLLSEADPDVKLIIAGDGPDRERLELLTEDLDLKNVEFIGYISNEQKHELLASSDLFCSPAVYGESFGIVLLEAMATGLVTVAGNNSGYRDLMSGLGALSIVDPHDAEEFARRLKLLLSEPKLRKLWQAWATEYVQQYSYKNIVDEYEKHYAQIMRRHG
jgi:phosphatidylinositol alpha-mannosyltransferase